MWKLFNLLFGWQYVIFVDCHNQMKIHKVYEINGSLYANAYMSDSRCELLAGGGVSGVNYIHSWRPATIGMNKLFGIESTLELDKDAYKKGLVYRLFWMLMSPFVLLSGIFTIKTEVEPENIPEVTKETKTND